MARVAGYMALPVLLAPIFGPIIAGTILQYTSWRWLFLVNLPVGAVALLMVYLFLPSDLLETTRRDLDWLGLSLLSPGLMLFLYGSQQVSPILFCLGSMMIAVFLWMARQKGNDALIDLRLFKRKVFLTSSFTQFLSNGGMFAGQMLIPAFLIQACGRTPSEMGWMLAPLGIGMMVTNALMGMLTDRFGIRRVSAGGALLTLVATLPFPYLAQHGLEQRILIPALFLRGIGMSAVGLPSITAAYASVNRQELPIAATSLNIVQRLGGPTMTTLCASFLAWQLGPHIKGDGVSTAYTWSFLLLCTIHALTFAAAIRLPSRIDELPSSDRN